MDTETIKKIYFFSYTMCVCTTCIGESIILYDSDVLIHLCVVLFRIFWWTMNTSTIFFLGGFLLQFICDIMIYYTGCLLWTYKRKAYRTLKIDCIIKVKSLFSFYFLFVFWVKCVYFYTIRSGYVSTWYHCSDGCLRSEMN